MHYVPGQTRQHGDPDSPGDFERRPAPLDRDFHARAFTVGIGGPVGSGKTALLLALCRALRDDNNIAVVTNDIFTKEDAEFLTRNQALVFDALSASEAPLSAYTILDKLRGDGFRAPLQVYRALEKLQDLGLVHRLESINAFVACAHPDQDCCSHGLTAFTICESCGKVTEFHDHMIEERLAQGDVAAMERAHGRDEGDPVAAGPPGGEQAAQVRNGAHNLGEGGILRHETLSRTSRNCHASGS